MARSWPNVVAMPSPVSFGMAAPHPAFCAARASTAAWRFAPPTEFGAEPALRPVEGVGGRAGIAPRAIEQGNTKGGWINPPRMGGLIHEALDRPIGPAGC